MQLVEENINKGHYGKTDDQNRKHDQENLQKRRTVMKSGSLCLDPARTCVAGILNLTPDSFSDGGVYEKEGYYINNINFIVCRMLGWRIICSKNRNSMVKTNFKYRTLIRSFTR